MNVKLVHCYSRSFLLFTPESPHFSSSHGVKINHTWHLIFRLWLFAESVRSAGEIVDVSIYFKTSKYYLHPPPLIMISFGSRQYLVHLGTIDSDTLFYRIQMQNYASFHNLEFLNTFTFPGFACIISVICTVYLSHYMTEVFPRDINGHVG